MKKNKLLLIIVLSAILFSACKKDENTAIDYKSLSVGKWLCTHVNQVAVKTNDALFMELTSTGKQYFGMRYTSAIASNMSSWMESKDYTYSISDNLLTITGKNALGDQTKVVLEITLLDDNYMTYGVQSYTYNGVAVEDNNVYTLKKIKNDYSSKIIGIWTGFTYNERHYWQYYADGTYDYYSFDSETGTYVPKQDNNGHYYMYGDFLASNFYAAYNTEESVNNCECWYVSFSGNNMSWHALRNTAAELTSLSMTKVNAIGDR